MIAFVLTDWAVTVGEVLLIVFLVLVAIGWAMSLNGTK